MKERLVLSAAALLLLMAAAFSAAALDFGPSAIDYTRSLGLFFAAIGLVFIFLQFVFSSRLRLIEAGFGLDRMLKGHRFFGRAGLVCLYLHGALIAAYRLAALGGVFPTAVLWIGLLALAGFTVTGALASRYRSLGLRYETWRGIHLANYALFPLALVHAFYFTRTGSTLYILWLVLPALFILLLAFRLARAGSVWKNPWEILSVRREAEGIWSLYFRGRRFDYRPGQFLFLRLVQGGQISSAHPFTISSSPAADYLSVTPKEAGDFTAAVGRCAVGDRALIDAPFGVFTLDEDSSAELVFIAGGIGITPFISMLRYMRDCGTERRVTLFWSNRSEKQFCFRDELAALENELDGFRLVPVMTAQPDWPGEKGRLDAGRILGSLEEPGRCEFYICGPPAMIRNIRAGLRRAGITGKNIRFELFEL